MRERGENGDSLNRDYREMGSQGIDPKKMQGGFEWIPQGKGVEHRSPCLLRKMWPAGGVGIPRSVGTEGAEVHTPLVSNDTV